MFMFTMGTVRATSKATATTKFTFTHNFFFLDFFL
jgi:hypothetical protein